MSDQQIEEFLWRATETRFGIELETSDLDALKRKLYQARAKAREAGNHSFDCLQFITPVAKANCRLWIVKLEEAQV